MSGDLKFWYLHNHKLFRNLSYSEINGLCILKRFKKSKKNELVDLPFDDKEKIYLLKHGTLKLIKINDEGDEITIDLLQKGDVFGEIGLTKPINQSEYFKVVSDEAIICTFLRENLEHVMLQKPDFAIKYIKFIGFNFQKLQNNYKNILFKDAESRLLLFLHSLLEKENILSNTFILPNYLTQKDISQLICTTRQTVNKIFSDFAKDGLIEYNPKEILIKDVQKIKKLTENVK